MKLVSNDLYDKIPLFYKLENMSIEKLIKYAFKNYGIVFNNSEHSNKYDLIDDILQTEYKYKPTIKDRFKEVVKWNMF